MDIVYWGNFALIPIAILELILGIYILSRRPRSAVSVSFAILCFSVALWVFGNGLGFILEISNLKWVLYNMVFLAASMIAGSFLYFSWIFPFKSKIIRLRDYLLVILPVIFFGATLIFTDWFIKGMDYSQRITQYYFGFLYHVFAVYFIFFWVGAFINLIIKYRKSDGIHRWQLKYLLWGVALSSIFGMGYNLIIPWVTGLTVQTYDFIGPGSSIIWLGMVSYIIWKK